MNKVRYSRKVEDGLQIIVALIDASPYEDVLGSYNEDRAEDRAKGEAIDKAKDWLYAEIQRRTKRPGEPK
jgi:hypothetical protein